MISLNQWTVSIHHFQIVSFSAPPAQRSHLVQLSVALLYGGHSQQAWSALTALLKKSHRVHAISISLVNGSCQRV